MKEIKEGGNNFDNNWQTANQIAALYSYDRIKSEFSEEVAREEKALIVIFIHTILSQPAKVEWFIEDMKTLEPRNDIEAKKSELLEKLSNIKLNLEKAPIDYIFTIDALEQKIVEIESEIEDHEFKINFYITYKVFLEWYNGLGNILKSNNSQKSPKN